MFSIHRFGSFKGCTELVQSREQLWALCCIYQLGLQNVSFVLRQKGKNPISVFPEASLPFSCHSAGSWSSCEPGTENSQGRAGEERLKIICLARGAGQTSRAVGLTSLHTADGSTLWHNQGLLDFQWLLCLLWDVLFHDLSWLSPLTGSQTGSAVPSALLLALPHPRTSSTPASVLPAFGEVYWKAFILKLAVLNPTLWPHFPSRGQQSHNSMRRRVLVRNLK